MTDIAPNYHKVQKESYSLATALVSVMSDSTVLGKKNPFKNNQIQHRSTFSREFIWKIITAITRRF